MLKKVHVQGLVISLIASSLLAACSGKRGFKPVPIKGADPFTISGKDNAGGEPTANQNQGGSSLEPNKDETRTRTAPVLDEADERVISETLEPLSVEVKVEEAEGAEEARENLIKAIDQKSTALAEKVLGLSVKKYVVKNGTAAADFAEVVGIHVKTLVNEEDGVLSDKFFEGSIQLSGGKVTPYVALNEVKPGGQENAKASDIKVFASCQEDKCGSLRILVDATVSGGKVMAAVYKYMADENSALELKYVGGSLGDAYMSYEAAYKKYQEETYSDKDKKVGTDGVDLSVLPDGEGPERTGFKKAGSQKSETKDIPASVKADDKKQVSEVKVEAKTDASKGDAVKKDGPTVYPDTETDGQFMSVLPNGEGTYRIDQKEESDSSSSDSLGEKEKDRSARLLKEKRQAQNERNNEVAKAYAAELAAKAKEKKN